jgi:predicted secreted protein
MASSGHVIGNDIGIYINVDGSGGALKLIAAGTGASYSADRQVIDVTSKNNSGARAIKMGGKSVNFTFTGNISFDESTSTAHGYEKLLTAWNSGTSCTVRFSTNVNGDSYIQCTAYIANISGDAPVNAVGTYTIDIQSTGDITIGTET